MKQGKCTVSVLPTEAKWYGMCKTLVGTMWAAWRETENVPEGVLRFKIAKKIDKYC